MLFKIFWIFTRVALFSWGGGPASLALMQREVTHAGWVTSSEFADAVAISNALPGPIAPQVSAYIGYKLARLPGAIMAVAGTVLPTTLLMLVMIVYFYSIKDSPAVKAMLKAVRPVVVGFLLWTAYDMAANVFGVKAQGWASALTIGWDKILIVLAAFVLLTFTKVHPVLLIVGAAVLGFLAYR
ncbi:MAG: chromate transporter [Candidatus Aminicenantes bacterium]|nr:chromate transporter [Candidatus Aminicenantes bacterium]